LLFFKIFIQNIKDFNYLSLIKDNILLIYREIKRATHKAIFNKILTHTNYTNKVMRQFVNNALKQICFLFEKYFFKKNTINIVQKRNYDNIAKIKQEKLL